MLSLAQVEAWVRSGESEVTEFKKSTGELRAGMQTICGMLNHCGGRVTFGVDPGGSIIGQAVSAHTIEEISQEIKREMEPPAFPSIEQVEVTADRHLVVISADRGQSPPYTYRGQAYRRVGNTTLKLSREEYNRILLERLHGEQRWETTPATHWSMGDLDVAEITRTLDEAIRRGRADDPGTRDPLEILRGFGLVRRGQLLRSAIMLFGRNERLQANFTQCLLRLAKFRGVDKTEFLDNRRSMATLLLC